MAIPIDNSVIERLDALDPDRMRAARLAEPEISDRLFALYAFHAELAKVPELVSEPVMGQIRYQWWRDCLDEIYQETAVRAHEVSEPLAAMIAQSGISRFLLDRIIDGRERDLEPRPFEDLGAAIDYADATSGALAAAAVTLCGGQVMPQAGRLWGLTGLARSYRYYSDGMLKNLEFADLLSAILSAYSEVRKARPAEGMPAIAYVSLVPGFAKRMQRTGYDPLTDVPAYSPFRKQIRLLRAVASGRL